MEADQQRAATASELLKKLAESDHAGPAAAS